MAAGGVWALRGRTQATLAGAGPPGLGGAHLTPRVPCARSPPACGALPANTEPADLPAGGRDPGALCPQPPPSSSNQRGHLHLPPPPTPHPPHTPAGWTGQCPPGTLFTWPQPNPSWSPALLGTPPCPHRPGPPWETRGPSRLQSPAPGHLSVLLPGPARRGVPHCPPRTLRGAARRAGGAAWGVGRSPEGGERSGPQGAPQGHLWGQRLPPAGSQSSRGPPLGPGHRGLPRARPSRETAPPTGHPGAGGNSLLPGGSG